MTEQEQKTAISLLEQIIRCPMNIDSATVPKAGIQAAPEQVVYVVSIGYVRIKMIHDFLEQIKTGSQPAEKK